VDVIRLNVVRKCKICQKQIHIIYLIVINTRLNKGNDKITELRTIFQRESQNSSIYKQTKSVKQPENCENRNDPYLVQAFVRIV
jgi:hypothetical protein